jgi:hypothetical protein
MAAYHKVEVSLNTNAVEVGIPSPQTVNVVVPTIGPAGPVGSVGPVGPQGPQGVPGTGLEVLTTQGDILYQGASTGQRLAIGTSGQVLKVANGIPAWGNESGAVTSVNGRAGAVTITDSDIVANYLISNTTVNGSSAGLGIPPGTDITSFTVPSALKARVVVAQSTTSDLTINLNTSNPSDGDSVRVEVAAKSFAGNKVVVATGGFGTFDGYDGHAMDFAYSTRVFPNRWLRLVEPYNRAAPASRSDSGVPGDFAADARYIYFCVANNTWRRVAIANW